MVAAREMVGERCMAQSNESGDPEPRARLSRRATLGGLAVASAATLLPITLVSAQAAVRLPRLIDVHHHHVPPEYLAPVKEGAARLKTALPPPMRDWTPAKSLEAMDRNGIAASVLVLAQSQGAWNHDDLAGMARLARQCNEFGAKMVQDHPGRYGFYAWLPMPDIDGSLKEIAYGLDELKAEGIGFFTSYDNKWPGDPAFAPVFEELNRRKAVVYFHPWAPPCCGGLIPGVSDNYIEYTQDTARAVLSLLFSGSLARCRDIRWVFSHGGGPIPVLAGRVNTLATTRGPDLSKVAPDGIIAELKRLHY